MIFGNFMEIFGQFLALCSRFMAFLAILPVLEAYFLDSRLVLARSSNWCIILVILMTFWPFIGNL